MVKTIIAIEDDPQISELIEVLLESDEVNIRTYQDGPSGLNAILDEIPDLVLLDVKVPGMSGLEIHAEIRQNPPTRSIPVIFLSVTEQAFQQRVQFTRSLIDYYMTKPFDILALRERIKLLLDIDSWEVPDSYQQAAQNSPRIQPRSAMRDRFREHKPKDDEAET
ncbi:MAG: two-component system response regulator [Anaerolineales bacterium]